MADRQIGREEVQLRLGGQLYGGWTSVSIAVDLEAGASAFDLALTKREPGNSAEWRVEADAPCEVLIGGELVITGYTDRIESSLGSEDHSIGVSGRSKTGDLVDCSATATPGSWRNRKLEDIAGELAKPFGIAVTAGAATGAPIRLFALQQGETVWEAIARLCQHRGLLPFPRADGSVAIISAKPAGASVHLAEGDNLLSIRGSHDVTDRFSQYIVKGQSAGDDDLNGKQAAQPKGEARDPAVKRYRPLVIVGEEQTDLASAKTRAEWEAVVRAAKAQSADADVLSWRRSDGALWKPGDSVFLDAPSAWIVAPMMVSGVRFVIDERGRRAELHIVRPESYSQLPVPEEAESSRIRKDRK